MDALLGHRDILREGSTSSPAIPKPIPSRQDLLRIINPAIKNAIEAIDRRMYKCSDFVIISNNCWGGQVYRKLGAMYNTPFVGLFLHGPDYIRLLEDFDRYTSLELEFTPVSKWTGESHRYPIGALDDVEIHFLHYKDRDEASSKWNKRVTRMKAIGDFDKYYFKICDRDGSDASTIRRFHALPFRNKISFGIDDLDIENHFRIRVPDGAATVPDGVELYRKAMWHVDILKWVESGTISTNPYSRLKSLIKI